MLAVLSSILGRMGSPSLLSLLTYPQRASSSASESFLLVPTWLILEGTPFR